MYRLSSRLTVGFVEGLGCGVDLREGMTTLVPASDERPDPLVELCHGGDVSPAQALTLDGSNPHLPQGSAFGHHLETELDGKCARDRGLAASLVWDCRRKGSVTLSVVRCVDGWFVLPGFLMMGHG